MTTLERLLQSVFAGKKFESGHRQIEDDDIFSSLTRLPFSLSKSQRTAIYRALKNDISYIQGPPGTGKSFTISALAIAASEMGMKVLIASQKRPAVDIVHEKVTNILGQSVCLYISDDQQTKQKTRGVINELLAKATDYQTGNEKNDLARLTKTIKVLVDERQEYAVRISDYESELREYYDNNQNAWDSRKVLEEDFALQESTIRKINLLSADKSRTKAKELLKIIKANNIFFRHGDGGHGWVEQAPFDRIIVTACAFEIPNQLIEQLNEDGIMIVPVGEIHEEQVLKKVKKSKGKIYVENLEKVRFVPLIEGVEKK